MNEMESMTDSGGTRHKGATHASGASISAIAPQTLAAMLEDNSEIALVDAREEGVFARSHPLFAASLPLSRIEERVYAMIPRLSARVVVTSDGDGLAERALRRLLELGYTNVHLLDGGNAGWKRAGFRLFSGIHVPSKAFGELAEARYETPMIEAAKLKALIDAGRDVAIFDSRPAHEYRRMNIPGAANCPGGDLVYRLPAVVRSPDTLVVVNCAGRTRSIIGAQSLINAGMPNRVVALKNGTMGWHLAGLPLEHGNERHVASPDPAAVETSRKMAASVRSRFGVKRVGLADLALMRSDRNRTVYLFDVRSPDEFAAGHLPGSRHAPGGQLVQATDAYMATRRAQVVLVDDDGVRATMTASWLLQMGWREAFVLDDDEARGAMSEAGASTPLWPGAPANIPKMAPAELAQKLERCEAALFDLALSSAYRARHVRGARWAIRSRHADWLPQLPAGHALVLTSDDGRLAEFAAAELIANTNVQVQVLDGGTDGWQRAGLPVESGFDPALEPPDDIWHIPSSSQGGGEQAMKQYLAWEVDLVKQLVGEPGVDFNIPLTTQDELPVAGAIPDVRTGALP